MECRVHVWTSYGQRGNHGIPEILDLWDVLLRCMVSKITIYGSEMGNELIDGSNGVGI